MITPNLISQHVFSNEEYRVDVLRLDQMHPEVNGNKWFKLKLNIEEAQRQNKNTLLTFGGAYSNHIAATAAAASQFGFKSVAVVRGEANSAGNPTLKKAIGYGMQLHFVDRETYKNKDSDGFTDLLKRTYGDFYRIPEGGNNTLGALGCKDIIQLFPNHDYLLCACGTGTTYSGLMLGKQNRQVLIGVNVLKGRNQLLNSVNESLFQQLHIAGVEVVGNESLERGILENSLITDQYAFSGYAGYDQVLIDFKTKFESHYQVPLDYIYTTKLFYACFDLLSRNKFKKGSSLLVIHSGGLQGNAGFEERYFNRLMR